MHLGTSLKNFRRGNDRPLVLAAIPKQQFSLPLYCGNCDRPIVSQVAPKISVAYNLFCNC